MAEKTKTFYLGTGRRKTAVARVRISEGKGAVVINGRPLESPEAFRRAVLDLQGRSSALVVVQRGTGRYHVTVPLS